MITRYCDAKILHGITMHCHCTFADKKFDKDAGVVLSRGERVFAEMKYILHSDDIKGVLNHITTLITKMMLWIKTKRPVREPMHWQLVNQILNENKESRYRVSSWNRIVDVDSQTRV